jgi:hypothetical protein
VVRDIGGFGGDFRDQHDRARSVGASQAGDTLRELVSEDEDQGFNVLRLVVVHWSDGHAVYTHGGSVQTI